MPRTAPPPRWVVLVLALIVVGGMSSFAYQLFISLRTVRAIAELSTIPQIEPSPPPGSWEPEGPDEALGAKVTDEPGRRLALLWIPHDLEAQVAQSMSRLGLEASGSPADRLGRLESLGPDPSTEASFAMGLVLSYQIGDVASQRRGATCLDRAARDGHARALTELGRVHLNGRGVPPDSTLATRYLDEARASGDAEATFLLGMAHRLDLIPDANPRLARPLLVEAAKQGQASARLALYWLQQEGALALFDREQPLAWLEDSARAGNMTCQLEVATRAFAHGDIARAAEMLTLGVEAGSLVAAERLTQLCLAHPEICPVPEILPHYADRIAADPTSAEPRAVLLRAFVALGRDGSSPQAHAWLAQVADRGETRARVALLLLQNGTSVADAYGEVCTTSDEGIYLRRLELEGAANEAGPDHPPRPIEMHEPEFPHELRNQKIVGRAVVAFVVDTTGAVRDAELAECSDPAFGEAALTAIRQWRFKPGKKGGRVVNMRMKQPFRFALDD